MPTISNKAAATIMIAIIAILGGLFVLAMDSSSTSECSKIPSTEKIKHAIEQLDHEAPGLATSTRQLPEVSTEGGLEITYSNNGQKKIVEHRLYGESGKSFVRFYFSEGSPFAVIKLNIKYRQPIYVNSNTEVSSTEERKYFLSGDGQVCEWYLNGSKQPTTADVNSMMSEYISNLLI